MQSLSPVPFPKWIEIVSAFGEQASAEGMFSLSALLIGASDVWCPRFRQLAVQAPLYDE